MCCPQCGARAEYPDCESCGYDFANGESSSAVTVSDGRGGEWQMDSLAMSCPQCGARAEYPDCESCGYDFTNGESSSAVTVEVAK